MRIFYNELEDKYITEAEFIADCKAYIADRINANDGESIPSLEEVINNTDYIYEVEEVSL